MASGGGSIYLMVEVAMPSGDMITYYEIRPGRWIRREWKRQCSARVFIYGRCQGVKGHTGMHWRYSPSGDFDWANNKDDPASNFQGDGVAGSTPPGDDEYVHPEKMQEHYHASHYTDTEVTDKAIIAMLEKGKPPERGAAMDRPVRDKATLAMLKDRMPKRPGSSKRRKD
jgi:hypothetical protein